MKTIFLLFILSLFSLFADFGHAAPFNGICSSISETLRSRVVSLNSDRIEKSTKELYGLPSNEPNHFFGLFQEIRKSLDLNYHGNYIKERQELQDLIIQTYLDTGQTSESPIAVFTAGPMGVGKSYTLTEMHKKNQINLSQYVWINPDEIKDCLPEMPQYVTYDHQTGTKNAGTKSHPESAYIQEIVLQAALNQKKNFIFDGSMHYYSWHKELLKSILTHHPSYSIKIIQVVANEATIFERIEKRGQKTGRFVPHEVVLQAIRDVPETIEKLRNDFSPEQVQISTIMNNDSTTE